MSDRTRQHQTGDSHCPFLNAADPQCSAHFSLGSLEHAFDYCLGRFSDCALFEAMCEQRRARRAARMVGAAPEGAGSHETSPRVLVSLHISKAKVPAAHPQPLPTHAGVPALPRF